MKEEVLMHTFYISEKVEYTLGMFYKKIIQPLSKNSNLLNLFNATTSLRKPVKHYSPLTWVRITSYNHLQLFAFTLHIRI